MFWRLKTFAQDVFGTFPASPVLVSEERLVVRMVTLASSAPVTVPPVEVNPMENQFFQLLPLQVRIV